MHHLPERAPPEIYDSIAAQLGWTPALVRAIVRCETGGDSRWISFDAAVWRRYRPDAGRARDCDKIRDVGDLLSRWQSYLDMDEACARGQGVERWAFVLAHRHGFGAILGADHKFAGCDSPEMFREAMASLQGQAHCLVAWVRSSERLLELGRRMDLKPRMTTLLGREHVLRLGDLSELASIWRGAKYQAGDVDLQILKLLQGEARDVLAA